jgi:formate--tetrahydrofolate ligase
MLSDIEIAQAARLDPIARVAARLDLPEEAVIPYGRYKAKIDLAHLASLPQRHDARLILVTAVSPTPAGEGKTTTSVGLSDALCRLGHRAIVALREPSMGPVFGMKGGAAGGGYAQVVPMEDINLHFTGDFAAIAAAHNLLAALLDNHLHHGNALGLDVRRIAWKRVLDVNDRALRHTLVGLGGTPNGVPREDGFDIVVASEVMAIFCLADSIADLKQRLARIIVGYRRDGTPVHARDLKAEGAMTALLKDALQPNLVQTLEHNPALIHGGPFANIAHGCNSVIATRAALKLADYVVTEAGFGADLGAEKFLDIKCRSSGLRPHAAVVVVSLRALKYHGGASLGALQHEDMAALDRGFGNLDRHLANLRRHFGLPCVVALNRFDLDTQAEISWLERALQALEVPLAVCEHWAKGSEGATALARAVLEAAQADTGPARLLYPDEEPLQAKIESVARKIYGAASVNFDARAAQALAQYQADGHGHLPVCIAKTPYSFSSDAALRGTPTPPYTLDVREVRLAAGAGFVVAICGDVMTMPGLPKVPAAERIDVDDAGRISGLS